MATINIKDTTEPKLVKLVDLSEDSINEIAYAPTVDAVEVVRCKDCKHKPSGTGANHDVKFPDEICPCQCEDYWYSWIPKDDFFCAFGERREDDKIG